MLSQPMSHLKSRVGTISGPPDDENKLSRSLAPYIPSTAFDLWRQRAPRRRRRRWRGGGDPRAARAAPAAPARPTIGLDDRAEPEARSAAWASGSRGPFDRWRRRAPRRRRPRAKPHLSNRGGHSWACVQATCFFPPPVYRQVWVPGSRNAQN